MQQGRYFKKYNIVWPHSQILETALSLDYTRGSDQAGILWPVDEARVPPECEWAQALVDFTKGRVSIDRLFFSKVHQGGLPIHRDHGRQCALNFFVTGDFDNTYNIFVDDFDSIIEKFNGSEPALINTRQFHGVINHTDEPRIVLSVSFYEPYLRIINKKFHQNNEVFYIKNDH